MKLYYKVSNAVDWALKTAKDDKCGYSQVRRTGPDYDCSSFVASALKAGGFDINPAATTTFNLDQILLRLGFSKMKYTKPFYFQRGDIVLNDTHHVGIMSDSDHIVHASCSETRGKDGKPGDQTGREIAEVNFYDPSYGWNNVYRYTAGGEELEESVFSFIPVLKYGSKGEAVSIAQAIMAYKMNMPNLEIDGIFGAETYKAVQKFQTRWQLTVDGVIGMYTWQALFTKGAFINNEF